MNPLKLALVNQYKYSATHIRSVLCYVPFVFGKVLTAVDTVPDTGDGIFNMRHAVSNDHPLLGMTANAVYLILHFLRLRRM